MPVFVRNIFLILLFFGQLCSKGQKLDLLLVSQKSKTTKSFGSVKLMITFLDKEISKLNADGYLEAVYDTISTEKGKYTATLVKGNRFK